MAEFQLKVFAVGPTPNTGRHRFDELATSGQGQAKFLKLDRAALSNCPTRTLSVDAPWAETRPLILHDQFPCGKMTLSSRNWRA